MIFHGLVQLYDCDVIGPAAAYKYTPNLYLCPAYCLVPMLAEFIWRGSVAIDFENLLSFCLAGVGTSLVAGETGLQDDGRLFNQ